mgnify:CR=1 FL=1|jgi:hypothetical protein|uniref:Tail collar fiber protein n=1 Tax=Caudovirales sp. ctGAB12 TaxID=2827632 RepID=A0A8S5SQP1_9CAUD|nr:MAG TPA: tail collar fiber protein [Caudovirales sp. ctGAB12]
MAEWSNATMTDVGADLQAKVNAGKTKLTFTKIKVGSGVNTTNPLALTDVISSKWETTNFVVKQEGKIVSVDTFITNNGITEAFRMSEIGLFAQDPDKGEVLYAYLTDPEPDRMPAEGGSVVVSQELNIGMIFSNTGNVSLTVNMGALVNQEQLKEHNTDVLSHPAITAMIAKILGATDWQENPISNLKDIKNLLGQGAIVASKLDANAGFVKYANGFTIQWGIGGKDNAVKTEVIFPIKFTTLFMANAIDAYWSGSDTPRYFANSVSESNATKAVFVASDQYAASYYWFALGVS